MTFTNAEQAPDSKRGRALSGILQGESLRGLKKKSERQGGTSSNSFRGATLAQTDGGVFSTPLSGKMGKSWAFRKFVFLFRVEIPTGRGFILYPAVRFQ